MRRTLLTVATFVACTFGVGYATADLMPAPPGTGTDVVLDTTERVAERSPGASVAAWRAAQVNP
jgi:hypothetical protein